MVSQCPKHRCSQDCSVSNDGCADQRLEYRGNDGAHQQRRRVAGPVKPIETPAHPEDRRREQRPGKPVHGLGRERTRPRRDVSGEKQLRGKHSAEQQPQPDISDPARQRTGCGGRTGHPRTLARKLTAVNKTQVPRSPLSEFFPDRVRERDSPETFACAVRPLWRKSRISQETAMKYPMIALCAVALTSTALAEDPS